MAKKGEPLTEEQKQRMAEGRRHAAERRAMAAQDVRDAERIAAMDSVLHPIPYDLFLASLDSETRNILSDAELRAIFAASEAKAKEEKRARLQKAAAERALEQAKTSAGLIPAEKAADIEWRRRMNELVTFTPHLPEACYIEHFGCACLVINGKPFRDGVEVTTTRGEYMTLREMVWRAQQAELDFEGRGRLHHLRRERFASLETRVSLG